MQEHVFAGGKRPVPLLYIDVGDINISIYIYKTLMWVKLERSLGEHQLSTDPRAIRGRSHCSLGVQV